MKGPAASAGPGAGSSSAVSGGGSSSLGAGGGPTSTTPGAVSSSAAPVGGSAAAGTPTPSAHTPQGGGGCATRDLTEDELWTRGGPGWTGADGTYSVGLPDGGSLWMFGDTFLGTVRADGTRPTNSPFVHNSLVVEHGGTLSDVGGTSRGGLPAATVTPADSSALYWPGAGVIDGGVLRWFVLGFRVPSAWSFTFVGSAIVTLSLPSLTISAVTPLPPGGGVEWGTSLLTDGPYTYIYGLESGGYVHVARAPAGGLLGSWEYYDAGRWSSDPNSSSRVLGGVSSQFSVVRVSGRYELVSQNPGFSREISAFPAATPAGPFGSPALLYTTPTWGPGTYTYNAVAHPEQPGAGLLVSYNVNSLNPPDLYSDASLYRPRFIRVPDSCFPG